MKAVTKLEARPTLGADVKDVIAECIFVSRLTDCPVMCNANGHEFTVDGDSSVFVEYEKYHSQQRTGDGDDD